jgi:hypothetical protein
MLQGIRVETLFTAAVIVGLNLFDEYQRQQAHERTMELAAAEAAAMAAIHRHEMVQGVMQLATTLLGGIPAVFGYLGGGGS